jgi:hypothetical protein
LIPEWRSFRGSSRVGLLLDESLDWNHHVHRDAGQDKFLRKFSADC